MKNQESKAGSGASSDADSWERRSVDGSVGAVSIGNGDDNNGGEAFVTRAAAGVETGNGHAGFSGIRGDMSGGGGKLPQMLQQSFAEAQGILEHNRVLIQEISQNQESRDADGLSRNVGLIRELNTNISRVVDLYANLSGSFAHSISTNNAKNTTKEAPKRPRSGEQ